MSSTQSNYVTTLALVSGGILCFFAVALGAFGAHAFESILTANDRHDVYETANRYHFYHSVALLALGALANDQLRFRSLKLVCYLLIIGTLVFSGSLYLLAMTDVGWLGGITPIGGLLLLLAWLVFIKDVLTTTK